MTGSTVPRTRQRLGELVRRNLLTSVAPDRVGYHDLLRAFGAELAARGRERHRRTALRRLLNHYAHLADRADRVLNAHRRPIPTTRCERSDLLPEVTDHGSAVRLFATEYPNLLAATRLAQRDDWQDYAWQLPWSLSNYAYLTARWGDWVETHERAAEAAGRAGRRAVEGRLRQSLGRAYAESGSHGAACREYRAALALHDDPRSRANALNGLGGAHVRAGEHAEAVRYAQRALALYERLGDRVGRASTLNLLGRALSAADPDHAADHHRRAFELFELLGDDYGRAHSAGALGALLATAGRDAEAAAWLAEGLRAHRAVGNLYYQAELSSQLAEVLVRLRRTREATALARDAATLLEQVGDPRAGAARERLAELARITPPGGPAPGP